MAKKKTTRQPATPKTLPAAAPDVIATQPVAQAPDLVANIAQATTTVAPGPGPRHVTVGKRPTGEYVTPAEEIPVQDMPAQPGSPCKVKGCIGRYSILQTVKVERTRRRSLICRTCNHQPPIQETPC